MAEELPPKKSEGSGIEEIDFPGADLSQTGVDQFDYPSMGGPESAPASSAGLGSVENSPSSSVESAPTGGGPFGGGASTESSASLGGLGGTSFSTVSGHGPHSSEAGVGPQHAGRGYKFIAPGVVHGNMTPNGKHLPAPSYSYFHQGKWHTVSQDQIGASGNREKRSNDLNPQPRVSVAPLPA